MQVSPAAGADRRPAWKGGDDRAGAGILWLFRADAIGVK
jgi:hypothetical protein